MVFKDSKYWKRSAFFAGIQLPLLPQAEKKRPLLPSLTSEETQLKIPLWSSTTGKKGNNQTLPPKN